MPTQSKQQQDLKKLKTKMSKAELPEVTKELNKEMKNIRKTKRAISVVDKAQKQQLKSYLETIKDKVDMILNAIDQDKVEKAGLAQLAKAFRSLASEMMSANQEEIKKIEQKSLNINIDVKNMSSSELLEFLSKKSQEHD
jgi:flagellar basal body-associated protein FliL